MPKCRDCVNLKWSPVCRAYNLLNRDPVGDETAEHDCSEFQPAPKPLVDELAEALEAVLHAHTGAWFSHTNLPGKTEDAEAEAQKLEERGYTALARYQKEKADGQQ